MELSVVILNYNTFDLTCQCIESVLATTQNSSVEVILVDNASTERNPEEFKRIFPSIILVENKINEGFARGNNTGISIAKGDVILLLNSDTIVKNNAIRKCFNFITDRKDVAVVTGKLLYPDGTLQHNCQRFPSIKYPLLEFLRVQKIFPGGRKLLMGPFFKYDTVAFPDWVWGTFFMFRRSVLKELPGEKLADDFFMYGEDMQWCMEFAERGYRIAFLPDAEIIHLMGKSNGNKNLFMKRNLDVFMEKYYAGWETKAIRALNKMLG
jgi:GT2 family glycosyltransferase